MTDIKTKLDHGTYGKTVGADAVITEKIQQTESFRFGYGG